MYIIHVTDSLSVESAARDSPAKCRQNARLFLQSSELGLPHTLIHRRVCSPLLWFGGGGIHTHCGKGCGGVPIPTRGQTDTVVLLVPRVPIYALYVHRRGVGTLYTDNMHIQNVWDPQVDRKFFAHFVRRQVTELMEGSLEDEAA
jgi:hypothetical protein